MRSTKHDSPPIPDVTETAEPDPHAVATPVQETDSARGSSGALGTPEVRRIETDTDSDYRDKDRRDRPVAPDGYPELLFRDPERYELIEEHGRGGIGRVLRARDKELDRTVALKELQRPGVSSEARFVREAMITAKLQHPGIVPIHEAGRWPDGTPFYAMKLVEGESLKEKIAECRTLKERLALLPQVLAVAEAVGYAHEQGVIHRDLKPSNVVVGAFGETIVIDWGLAKHVLLGDGIADNAPYRLPAAHGLTSAGGVLGTPGYMAPEQERGEMVDERADVYALGAILRSALSCPVRPGREEQHRFEKAGPDRLLPADLAAIIRTAMAQDREDRFRNAQEFAADLRRFIDGQLVTSRPYGWFELTYRWLLRHRAPALSALIVLVAVVISFARVVQERNQAKHLERQALLSEDRATRERNGLVQLQAVQALTSDPSATYEWLAKHPVTDDNAWTIATIAALAAERGVATHIAQAHEKTIMGLVFREQGSEILSASQDGVLLRWQLESGVVEKLARGLALNSLMQLSADEDWLAYADSTAKTALINVVTGTTAHGCQHTSPVTAIAVSRDGGVVVSGDVKGNLKLFKRVPAACYDLPAARSSIEAIALGPDDDSVATCSSAGHVRLWRVHPDSSTVIGKCQPAVVTPLGVLPTTKGFYWGGPDGRVRVWTEESRISAAFGNARPKPLIGIAVSQDETRVAAAGMDEATVVWDMQRDRRLVTDTNAGLAAGIHFFDRAGFVVGSGTHREGRVLSVESPNGDSGSFGLFRYRGHSADVTHLVVSETAEGVERFATADRNGEIRVWPTRRPGRAIWKPQEADTHHARFAPDGQSIVSTSRDRSAAHTDLKTGRLRHLRFFDSMTWSIDFLEGSPRVAVSSADGSIGLWNLKTNTHTTLRGHSGAVWHVAFSPNETQLASGSSDRSVIIWDLDDGSKRVLLGHTATVSSLAYFQQGDVLVSVDLDGNTIHWDVATGNVIWSSMRAGRRLQHVETSQDSRLTLTVDESGEIRVRDLVEESERVFQTAVGPVAYATFAPDARTIGVAGKNGLILIDVATGESRRLIGHSTASLWVAFSVDGRYVASGGQDATLSVWDQATARFARIDAAGSDVSFLEFSPANDSLVAASGPYIQTVPLSTLTWVPTGPSELAQHLKSTAPSRATIAERN